MGFDEFDEVRTIGKMLIDERLREGKTLEECAEEAIEIYVEKRLKDGASDEDILREFESFMAMADFKVLKGVRTGKA